MRSIGRNQDNRWRGKVLSATKDGLVDPFAAPQLAEKTCISRRSLRSSAREQHVEAQRLACSPPQHWRPRSLIFAAALVQLDRAERSLCAPQRLCENSCWRVGEIYCLRSGTHLESRTTKFKTDPSDSHRACAAINSSRERVHSSAYDRHVHSPTPLQANPIHGRRLRHMLLHGRNRTT